MMRFVIADGLPYLLHNGKTYAVRWDEKGFKVGAEVKLASVPTQTLSALSVKAKYPHSLDSIGKPEQPEQTEQKEQEEEPSPEQPEQTENLDEMTLNQLKALAEAKGVDLGGARKKADIIRAIKQVIADD